MDPIEGLLVLLLVPSAPSACRDQQGAAKQRERASGRLRIELGHSGRSGWRLWWLWRRLVPSGRARARTPWAMTAEALGLQSARLRHASHGGGCSGWPHLVHACSEGLSEIVVPAQVSSTHPRCHQEGGCPNERRKQCTSHHNAPRILPPPTCVQSPRVGVRPFCLPDLSAGFA